MSDRTYKKPRGTGWNSRPAGSDGDLHAFWSSVAETGALEPSRIRKENEEMAAVLRKKVGLRIAQIRALKGVSQAELASHIGISRSYLGGIERGEKDIALSVFALICRRLEASPNDLLSLGV